MIFVKSSWQLLPRDNHIYIVVCRGEFERGRIHGHGTITYGDNTQSPGHVYSGHFR